MWRWTKAKIRKKDWRGELIILVLVSSQYIYSKETKIPQNCESPCTISRNTANDFITSGENKELKEATDNLKIDNEILNKKIENLESSLAECQNKENLEPSESKTARERIIKDLLS